MGCETPKPKRNMQDATLININALKKRVAVLEAEAKKNKTFLDKLRKLLG